MIVINQYRFIAGITLITVTFTTVSGTLVESPAGKWGGGPGFGVSSKILAASTDGYIQSDYSGVTYKDSVIGMDASAANTDYGSYDYAVGVDSASGRYAYVENGSITVHGSLTAVSGDKMRIKRTGSTFTAEKTTDGTNWTNIRTFTATSTAQMYLKANVIAATNYILNPKGFGIT